MSFCGQCRAPRPEDGRFCGECGADLVELDRQLGHFTAQIAAELLDVEQPAEPPPPPIDDAARSDPTPVYPGCPQCGAEHDPAARFCSACGHRFEPFPLITPSAAPGGMRAQVAFVHPQSEPARSMQAEPAHQPPAPAWQPEPTKSHANDAAEWLDSPPATNSKVLLVLVLAALLFLVGGGAAYWNGWIGDRPVAVAAGLRAELQSAGYGGIAVADDGKFSFRLTGTVDSAQERDAALYLARGFAGVGEVADELKVRIPLVERLAEFNGYIESRLGEPDAILAIAGSDNLVLTGRVSSAGSAQVVLAALREQFGLEGISDHTVANVAAAPSEPGLEGARGPVEDIFGGVASPAQDASPEEPRMAGRRSQRAKSAAVPAAEATPLIDCLLPSTDDVRLSLSECRARGGLRQ